MVWDYNRYYYKTKYYTHYLPQCPNYPAMCTIIFKIMKTIRNIQIITCKYIVNCYKNLSLENNLNITKSTYDFMLETDRLI